MVYPTAHKFCANKIRSDPSLAGKITQTCGVKYLVTFANTVSPLPKFPHNTQTNSMNSHGTHRLCHHLRHLLPLPGVIKPPQTATPLTPSASPLPYPHQSPLFLSDLSPPTSHLLAPLSTRTALSLANPAPQSTSCSSDSILLINGRGRQ